MSTLESSAGHIGYLGHLNFMLGAYRFLGGADKDDLHRIVTDALRQKLSNQPGLCLETYPGEIYLPDNLVVLASINLYAHTHGSRTDPLVTQWLEHARSTLLDPGTKLLPFWLDGSCRQSGQPRGSGAGWASSYLPFIDEQFAKEQYFAMKDAFHQHRLIGGFREYPKRSWSFFGDVDSGPVIAGFSPSGTGFALAGAVYNGDSKVIDEILFVSELAGSTLEMNGQRWYLAAPLVGDAILLAMKTAIVWR
jgi:hypothetical protein